MIDAGRAITLQTLPAYAQDRLAAAGDYSAECLQTRRFRLPMLDLDVRFSDTELAELFGQRVMQRETGETADNHAVIHLLDATLDGWDQPASWDTGADFTSREFDRVLAVAGKRGFYYHDAPSWQLYDPATGTGLHTMPRPMAVPPWETGSPLRLFLHWAYARPTMRFTHAATLGIDGRGALLAGASGSGKSGTTLAGLLNGLRSAGDDYVLVEQGEDVIAHAIFRVFKQDADGLRRTGVDAGALEGATVNWRGKYEFDARKLRPEGFAECMPIRAILLPEIARLPRTRIEPVSAKQAVLALAPSAVFQLPGDADDGFRFFAELTRRLPAFRVSLSENPAEIADAIATHLSREIAHAD